MPLTRDDLLFGSEFHDESIPCYGPRSNRWRRSGKTRTWKRNPDRLELPVKFGMYTSAVLTLETTGMHEVYNCPQQIEWRNKEPGVAAPPATMGT